jgi:hypothetical protein
VSDGIQTADPGAVSGTVDVRDLLEFDLAVLPPTVADAVDPDCWSLTIDRFPRPPVKRHRSHGHGLDFRSTGHPVEDQLNAFVAVIHKLKGQGH